MGCLIDMYSDKLVESNNIINKIEKIAGVRFSNEQMDVLLYSGSAAIIAAAGAGKTSTLVGLLAERIALKDIQSVDRLLVTTYSVSGKQEIESRLNSILNKLGITVKVEVKTLHSVYYKILGKLGLLKPIASEGQRMQAIKKAIKDNGMYFEDDDVYSLLSLISYQYNNMLTDIALFNKYNGQVEITPTEYSKIRTAFAENKKSMGIMDFDDLQTKLYLTLKSDENVARYVASLWNDFYIDEFQDISKIQYAILHYMCDPKDDGKTLVVIGDDDQCIYEWRGADPNIILNIWGTYNMKKFMLGTNYRCSSDILQYANNCIVNNKNRYSKNIEAYNKGGRITVEKANGANYYEMSLYAMAKIREMKANGTDDGDIAILVRNNVHGVFMDAMLSMAGIVHSVSGDAMFKKSNIVNGFRGILEMSCDTYDFNVVNENIWKCTDFLGFVNAQKISKLMRDNGCSLLQALKFILSRNCELTSGDSFVSDIDNSNSVRSYVRCYGDTLRSIKNLYELICVNYSLSRIKAGLLSEDAFDKNNRFKIANEKDGLKYIIKLYADKVKNFLYKHAEQWKVVDGVAQMFTLMIDNCTVEQMQTMLRKIDSMNSIELKPGVRYITVSTMHGAKGKEWKNVILLGADGYSCPSAATVRTGAGDIDNYIEQERRLYYVAMTRAKELLYIVFDGDIGSPFLYDAYKAWNNNGDDVDSNQMIKEWAENAENKALVEAAERRRKQYESSLDEDTLCNNEDEEQEDYTYYNGIEKYDM